MSKNNTKDRRDDKQDHGELAPLSAFLPGIMEGIKLAPMSKPETPQGRHHHTIEKQIEKLQALPQDSPEMGFMTQLLTLCSLPRTDPGTRLQYKRENGPYKMIMIRR